MNSAHVTLNVSLDHASIDQLTAIAKAAQNLAELIAAFDPKVEASATNPTDPKHTGQQRPT